MIRVSNHQTMIPDNVLSADKSLLSTDIEFNGYPRKNNYKFITVPLLGLQCKQQVT